MLRTVTARALEAARDPRRLLVLTAIVALLASGGPLAIAGTHRMVEGIGDWRSDAGTDWQRTRGRVVAVRDEPGLAVRVRYRDEQGSTHVVGVGLDGRSGRWIGPSVRLRYDANDHSAVDLAVDGSARPVVDLLLAAAPLGAGLAGILTAIALWRRRRVIVASDRPLVSACSAGVVGGVLLLAGLAAWSTGTVVERGWSGVGTAMSDGLATVFAEMLGILIPIVTFVIGCVLTAWLGRHRSRLAADHPLVEAYDLVDRAAEVVPSPDELRAHDPSDDDPRPSDVTHPSSDRRVNASAGS